VRLLAPLALQPRPHRRRQEPVQPRLEGAELGKLPRLPHGRGPLPVSQEGLSQRGRGALRRGSEDGSAPLQDLRPQDAGRLEQRIKTSVVSGSSADTPFP